MSSVQELELQLREAKQKALADNWEQYLIKTKSYLQSLVGRAFLRWYMNGRFTMFKVTGFTEQHYLEQGFYGQFSPNRWFELEVSGMINVQVGRSSRDSHIDSQHPYNYEFVSNKKGKLSIAKLEFTNSTCLSDIKGVYVFGKAEHSEGEPQYERALSNFTMFGKSIPLEVYESAKAIHDQTAQATINFWEKYKQTIENAPNMI